VSVPEYFLNFEVGFLYEVGILNDKDGGFGGQSTVELGLPGRWMVVRWPAVNEPSPDARIDVFEKFIFPFGLDKS
jgi:hypothetical protein